MEIITVTAGLIFHKGKYLIAQRRRDKSFEGLWEFPGGKIEPGESCQQCLKREINEEFNIDINVQEYISEVIVNYKNSQLHIYLYKATWDGKGDILICDHEQYAWVTFDEMKEYRWPEADMFFVEELTKKLKRKN